MAIHVSVMLGSQFLIFNSYWTTDYYLIKLSHSKYLLPMCSYKFYILIGNFFIFFGGGGPEQLEEQCLSFSNSWNMPSLIYSTS